MARTFLSVFSHSNARRLWASLFGLTLASTAVCCGSAEGQVNYEKIALTCDAAPGTNGVFLDFTRPTINAAGQTCLGWLALPFCAAGAEECKRKADCLN